MEILPCTRFPTMSSTIAFLFVDLKTNKGYHLKPGKQIIASKNYSGDKVIDLKLTCDDNVTPFLVELSVKKQSARLTCIVGYCIVNSIGVGPGGTVKLKNGTIVEFGEVEWPTHVEMQFIIQQDESRDESQAHNTNEVGQMKRPKRKLPETPGIPAQPPPKPARKFSANDQLPPPKPLRRKSAAAVITYSEVAEVKRKISREVNERKDLEEGSLGGSIKEVSVKVANSICYQLMLQPNGGDLITNKLIDDINNATKIMEQHMLPQMEKFLVTYKNYLRIQATPECLLPADTPVIKYLLDAIIRSPSMLEDTKEVCLVIVEVLVIFCSSKQNHFSIIANNGAGVVTTLMKMNSLQFCFELQCNCWKLLTTMMETMLENGCDQEGKFTAAVLEVSCSLARQQLSNFDNNCPLARAITTYLVSALTFCSKSSDCDLISLFKTLRDGDILQCVMRVSTNVKLNEQFKQQSSKLATLLAPELPPANDYVSELEASGDITISVHESFKKDLDSYHVSNSLKTSVSTSGLARHSKPKLPPPPPPLEHLTYGHKPLGRSQSDSSIKPHRKESKVNEAFYKFLHVVDEKEETKLPADITDHQEQIKSSADDRHEQNAAMHMVNQKQQTKSSSITNSQTDSYTESQTDTVDQLEQTKSPADITDQQEQTTPDAVCQQECTESSADLEQEEQTKSSSVMTDLQEQEKSSTDINDHQKQPKPSIIRRQMDMNNPYMKHTLKRQHKNQQNDTPTDHEAASSKRQSWSSDMSNFSQMPGTIKEFSKEQACVEEMMDAHEDMVEVLTTRMNAINTLVPLWHRGKCLQAAINAEASCFNDDDNDLVLFSDLLSLFKTYRSGWTLAVSLIFLRYFKQLLQNLSEPKYLRVIRDTIEMILERFADIILTCKHSTANNSKLSAQLDQQQKEMCYEELHEIQELVTKELAAKTHVTTLDQEAVEHYRKLQKILQLFRQPLS